VGIIAGVGALWLAKIAAILVEKTTTITVTEMIKSPAAITITPTVTTTSPIPSCLYRKLRNRTASIAEGDEILVWRGIMDCQGFLTIVTGGYSCEGAWFIRVRNAEWGRGWIEVP